ncbi:MAG: hypothetical protein F6K17_08275 [Okeania sp. SIO3C4]|nr:hypothetical protein [Okeania sp. SIO3C4]
MSIYTADYIRSLQSNLYDCSDPIISRTPFDTSINERESEYENSFFQLLVYTGNLSFNINQISSDDNEDISEEDFIILYGRKKNLIKIKDYPFQNLVTDSTSLPSKGVKLNKDFFNQDISALHKFSTSHTVRFLLQCRKLSQVLASIWINDEEKNLKQKLIKKIFDAYNIIPNLEGKLFFVNDEGKIKTLTQRRRNFIEGIIERQEDIKEILEEGGLEERIADNLESYKQDLSYVIKRSSVGYPSLSLSLLMSGQAYYYNTDSNNWEQICDPILSTYEIVWEYSFDVSWDTFYSTRIDLSESGLAQRLPYTKVTISYPPRPDEFSLKHKHIKAWVNAKDYSEDEDNFPFYPPRDSDEWNSLKIKYVAPPYPYLPMSSPC